MGLALAGDPTADALFVGDSTAKTDVWYILNKLHVRDRVQAVILAHETWPMQSGEHRT